MSKEGIVKNNSAVKRVAFFLSFLLFFVLMFALTKELVNRRQIDRQLADYQLRIDKLQSENSSLATKISSWDQSGELEASARQKLGLEKPGEQTIIIARNSSGVVSQALKSNQEVVDLAPKIASSNYESNVTQWWKYFFESNNVNNKAQNN